MRESSVTVGKAMKKNSRNASAARVVPRKNLRCSRSMRSTLGIYRESGDFPCPKERSVVRCGAVKNPALSQKTRQGRGTPATVDPRRLANGERRIANCGGLTPCRPHLRMKRPQRDGKTGFLRPLDRKSTRLNSSHLGISYAVFCL